MDRGSVFTLSSITALGLAMLPSSIVAQQETLRQQLLGHWTLVSCEGPQPFCANASGSLSLGVSGRSIQVMTARGRPKATAAASSRADVTPEYYKAIAQGVVANFGTWSVNEADKTLTRQMEGALFPNTEGTEQKFSVSLTGDELKLVPTATSAAAYGTVWRRAK
jgi:hypothetical protein